MAEEVLIAMGKCPTCGEDWSMSEGEQKYFKDIMEKKKKEGEIFSMPRHCRNCRKSKRNPILEKVEYMIKRARNNEYDFDTTGLLSDLQNLRGIAKKSNNVKA